MSLSDDRGSGTLLGMLAAMLMLCGGVIAWCIAGLAVAHQHASVAADLGALAAARAGCDAAVLVVQSNGAAVESCADTGGDAIVAVSVPGPQFLERLGLAPVRVSDSARAGPAEEEVE